MSADKLARVVVGLSARCLPTAVRERHREEWLADLSGASEAGVRPSAIALGSLVFAITLTREFGAVPTKLPADAIARRSRVALGLAFSAALLALTQYASVAGTGDSLSSNTAYDFFTFVAPGLLGLYAIAAPAAAAIIVSVTRGTSGRVRAGVWMLVPAGLAEPARAAIDSGNFFIRSVYSSPGTSTYLIALGLVVGAVAVAWPTLATTPGRVVRHRVVVVAFGGAVTLVAVVVGTLIATILWAGRVPLVFGDVANPSYYRQWLQAKTAGEAIVQSAFTVWLVCGIVFVALVVGLLTRANSVRNAILATAGALFAIVVAVAGLLSFLNLMESGTVAPSAVEVLLFLGRVGLVTVALYGVSGVRGRFRRTSPGVSSRARRGAYRAAPR